MRRILAVRKGWFVGGAALVALVVAGAIQASVGTDSTDGGRPTLSMDSPAVGPATTIAGADAAARSSSSASAGKAEIAPPLPPDGGGSTPVVPGSPRVVRTADMRVEVAEDGFGAAFERVASIAAANGGFVSSSSTSSADDARAGDLMVRVPADRFDTVRQSLGGLGKVESQSIRGDDVSGQLVDYEARLKSLQAQEEALRALVGQAKAVGDVLQVQSSLFDVRQQIEQLRAQKANLDQATSLASIQISLFEPGAPAGFRPVAEDRSLAHSFEEAVDGMLAVVGGMIVVLGYLVPVAVVGLLAWAASRLFWRRRPPAQAPAA